MGKFLLLIIFAPFWTWGQDLNLLGAPISPYASNAPLLEIPEIFTKNLPLPKKNQNSNFEFKPSDEAKKIFEDFFKQNETINMNNMLYSNGHIRRKGGDVSGGGSAIRFKNREPFLLDFIMVRPGFEETEGFTDKSEKIFNEPLTPENGVLGIKVDLKQRYPKVMDLVEMRLKLWEKNSPSTIHIIRTLMQKTIWQATKFRAEYYEDQFFPSTLPIDRSQVRVATVSKIIQGHGVFIISRMWDTFLRGTTSRAGLLVHEAVRTLQVEYSSRIQTKTIQTIVAHIMLSDPKDFKDHYLNELLQTDLWFGDRFKDIHASWYDFFIKNLCPGHDLLISDLDYLFESIPEKQRSTNASAFLMGLKTIDRVVREGLNQTLYEPFLKDLRKLDTAASLEEVDPLALRYWLEHFLDSLKVSDRNVIDPGFIKNSIIDGMIKNPWLHQKPIWDVLIQRVQELKPQVCGVKNANFEEIKEFSLLSNTLLKLIAVYWPNDEDKFYANFQLDRIALSPADTKMLEDALFEMSHAQMCKSKKSSERWIVIGGENSGCEDYPKKYFKGHLPVRPRINLK